MDSPEFSRLSSMRGEFKSEDFIQPHYKESYRLAIDRLVCDGRDSYQEFLKGERVGSFLSEDELLFITSNAEQLPPQKDTEEIQGPPDSQSSSGTYWPVHSDVDTPELDLGWPEVIKETKLQTNIDLIFHPPRQNNPSIKEVVRKHIQDARQVIAIVMDMFTDVDIFREIIDASVRGVPVYVLLDDSHLKSFLAMAENHDVKIHQLRNMRVRTVKGTDYLCRSGAKFHGAMEQKFLLVDCLTAIYGSYSFTWSFEKINLSMVQVITGHLVKSYDEEFRTLYARSTVPAELCPPEGLFQLNGPHGRQVLPNTHPVQKIERRDLLRHTMDEVYRKTCERKLGKRDFEERLFEKEPNNRGPFIENGTGVMNQMSHFPTADEINLLKRHSYAGEVQDGYLPQVIEPRASQWNISREPVSRTNNYPRDKVPQIYRDQNMCQPYNDSNKQILSMQQNMPTLENTSKSFMRTLRIESYLKNTDVPFGDSCDSLDQYEPTDKAGSYMQGRNRASYVFRPTPSEQMEPSRHINNTSPAAPPLHYTSMQWNPTAASENLTNNDEFMFKRPSLQILNDNRSNASYGQGRDSYHSAYASLGRAKGGQMITNPNILADSWSKRHSVADPRSHTEYPQESSDYMYGSFSRVPGNRSTAGINAQNGGYGSNLNDQRSVSHYDVKNIPSIKSPTSPNWQEPPSRTLSAAALDVERGSQPFPHKNGNKIKSLLNIPEKREDSVGTMETLSLNSGESTDTLTAADEEKTSDRREKPPQNKSRSSEHRRNWLKDDYRNSSKPRFTTEEQRHSPQVSLPKTTREKKPAAPDIKPNPVADSWTKPRGAQSRLYSRFEPFCSLEKQHPLRSAHGFDNTRSQSEKTKSPPKAETPAEHNHSRAARGHHENKLERFFQRVGNLMHKNK